MSIYCHKCGQSLPDDARFCMKCGVAILLTPEYREKIYSVLADAMFNGLDTGKVSVEDSKKMAGFILDQLDDIQVWSELVVFLNELSDKWPIYKSVFEQILQEVGTIPQAPAREERKEVSSLGTENFENQVELVQRAGLKEKVTSELFALALKLYDELEGSDNSALLNHPKKGLMKAYLQPFHDVLVARYFLNQRWEDDRRKRQEAGLFSSINQHKLVVTDYLVLSQKKVSWEFIDYLQLPNIETTLATMLLQCPRLLPYFDWIILDDIFNALLIDREDPKAYKEAYANIKENYGIGAEQLLKKLTT